MWPLNTRIIYTLSTNHPFRSTIQHQCYQEQNQWIYVICEHESLVLLSHYRPHVVVGRNLAVRHFHLLAWWNTNLTKHNRNLLFTLFFLHTNLHILILRSVLFYKLLYLLTAHKFQNTSWIDKIKHCQNHLKHKV